MDDQKILKKRLKVLMGLPHNQVCSDCPERQPRWASLIVPPPGAPPGSLPIGALCCLECSGSHRRLGVHISFVRSINLDSWKEKEVLAMENGGNAKVNAIFEARLPNPSLKPSNHADGSTRERYIRDKYERRKYFDAAGFDDYANSASSAAAAVPARSAPAPTNSGGSVGPPSDAAKQRLEQRRARINKSASSVDDSAATANANVAANSGMAPRRKVPIAQAPVSAPPPTMDLLDLMGGFDAPAPAAAAAAPTQQEQPKPASSSGIDLFDFVVAKPPAQQQQQEQQQAAQKPALDLTSLYNGSAGMAPQQQFGGMNPQQFQQMQQMQQYPQQQMQQQMQPNMMMANGGMMPQQQQQMNNMNQMTNAMQNMHFTPQQQQQYYQQQQQMMMMRQQQMMMAQQGNGSMFGAQNMMGGGFGMPANGNMGQMSSNQRPSNNATQAAAVPEKEDPFAQFGSNVFRS